MKRTWSKQAGFAARFTVWMFVCSLLLLPTLHGQRKKRVAVLSFETGADAQQTAQKLGVRDDLGLTLSNLMVNEIAGAGKVQVVERSALDRVLKEQNLSNSDRLDNTTAARIGKIVGVDAILIGSVTQFVGSSKETAGSKVWALANRGSGDQPHRMQTKVSVVLSARLIDVNTGVVIANAQGEGAAENLELQVNSGANNQQMGSPVLNEATLKAIRSTAALLNASPAFTETIAVARTAYKSTIVDADNNTLVLDAGMKAGARVGDVLQISRTGKTIKDKTGAVLKVMYETLGTAKITEVDDKTATATFSGSKPAKVDDVATFTP
ncbi:MAG: CsgG/HfaB family protein [Janthinobacterium lividum]